MEKSYVGSSPTIGIFLYLALAVENVIAVAFGIRYVGSSPTIGIFLYVARAVETHVSTSFQKQTMLVRVPLSSYFFM